MYKQCRTEQSARRQREFIHTLVEMMSGCPFEEITVAGICTRMGLPRKTFYRYFDTKEDLLQAMVDLLTVSYQTYALRRRPDAAAEEDLELFFSFWLENRQVLAAIRGSRLSGLLVTRMVDNTFRQRQGDPLAARFALTGLYGVLLEWAYTGFEASPAEMARKTARLFTQPLRQVLFVAAP